MENFGRLDAALGGPGRMLLWIGGLNVRNPDVPAWAIYERGDYGIRLVAHAILLGPVRACPRQYLRTAACWLCDRPIRCYPLRRSGTGDRLSQLCGGGAGPFLPGISCAVHPGQRCGMLGALSSLLHACPQLVRPQYRVGVGHCFSRRVDRAGGLCLADQDDHRRERMAGRVPDRGSDGGRHRHRQLVALRSERSRCAARRRATANAASKRGG